MVNDDDEDASTEKRGIHKFKETATGTVLAAGLLGVANALEGPRDEEVAIVQEYSGEPPFSDPILMRLDPDAPEDSIVLVRRPPALIAGRSARRQRFALDRVAAQHLGPRRHTDAGAGGHGQLAAVEHERLGDVLGEVPIGCGEVARLGESRE